MTSRAIAALGIGQCVNWGMTFAAGAGLTTLTRPYLVQSAFPPEQSGYLNGRLAQAQQFMRAVGPVLAASVAAVTGYAIVLGMLAAAIAALAFRAFKTSRLDG